MSTNVTINANIQIIQTLCRGTFTIGAILAALQSKFPTAGWTLTILQTYLTVGVSQGLYVAVGGDPNTHIIQGYQINKRALQLNSANEIYGPYCSNILPSLCCFNQNFGNNTTISDP